MARNPRELVIETILEGYRHEHRILADEHSADVDADMFTELFTQGQGRRQARRRRRRAPTWRIWRRRSSARAPGTGRQAPSAIGRSPTSSPPTSRALIDGITTRARIDQGGHMAWDFETDPEYQEAAGLGRRSSSATRSSRSTWSGRTCSSRRWTTPDARSIDPLKERGAPEGLVGHPSRPRARRPGLRPAQAGAAQRDPRPLAVGADRLRLPGTRHRQRRDHRALRHAGAEGALPAPAARRRAVLQLLDDRTAGRRRSHPVQDQRGARRRRLGDQRLEVLLLQRQYRVVPHRDGGDQPRRQRLPGHVDVPGADRHARREHRPQRRPVRRAARTRAATR